MNSTVCPTKAVILLGLTTKWGLLNTINAACLDCLSPAMFEATHRYTPLSIGKVSNIFKLPLSVIVTLKDNKSLEGHKYLRKLYRQIMLMSYWLNYLPFTSTSYKFPSFSQCTVGSGTPFGGEHSRTAGSPAATCTSLGSTLKSSRSTKKQRIRFLAT